MMNYDARLHKWINLSLITHNSRNVTPYMQRGRALPIQWVVQWQPILPMVSLDLQRYWYTPKYSDQYSPYLLWTEIIILQLNDQVLTELESVWKYHKISRSFTNFPECGTFTQYCAFTPQDGQICENLRYFQNFLTVCEFTYNVWHGLATEEKATGESNSEPSLSSSSSENE